MAEQRTRFVGLHEHGLDDKGRMVLPARIRGQLGETGMVGMANRCVGLWTIDGFDVIADRLSDAVDRGDAEPEAYSVFMAYAAEVTPDQQGRIVIPPRLRQHADLGSEVIVTGRGPRAEIWAPERWAAHVDKGATSPTEDGADVSRTFETLRF